MRRSNSQLTTIDHSERRLSQFLNIVEPIPKIPKKRKYNLHTDSMKQTAKAMKTFYNIKPEIKPQARYRWESGKNMADYVELGGLRKRGDCTPDKSRNNRSNLSMWDSLIEKTEDDCKFSTLKTFKSSSQDRVGYFLNPSRAVQTNRMKTLEPTVTCRKQCPSRNKLNAVGSIDKLLQTTPELKIKKTPYIKKKNQSNDFLNPDWGMKPEPVKKKFIDVDKVRTTKTYAGLCAPRRVEMNMKEIICFNAKERQKENNIMRNMNNNQTIGTYQHLKNSGSKSYLTNINLLEYQKKMSRNKSRTTISTGFTKDTRTIMNNKTIDYYK